jgi:RNA polymerase sigma factor (sigma-70 family)
VLILLERTSRGRGLARLRGVELEPFEKVVDRYGTTVLRVCRAVVGPVAAEDAWSETFLSALQAYPALRPGSNVEAWLVTIAHRKAIDQVRAQARRPVPAGELPERPSADGLPGSGDDDDELWAALKELPLKQRQCVAYHYLAGLPYAEIAALVGGTADSARRAAADGIAALRKKYQTGVSREKR